MKTKKVAQPPLRLVYAEAGSLAENPANWRTHSQGQMAALGASIAKRWAGALLFNEKTKRLIDGHARRKSVSPETPVPVLVGSWSEAEEKEILLTLDPIGAMAGADGDLLKRLMEEVKLDDAAMQPLLADLDEQLKALAGETPALPEDEGGGSGGKTAKGEGKDDPNAGKLASSFQVVAVCKNEQQQQRAFELLKAAGIECRINTLY